MASSRRSAHAKLAATEAFKAAGITNVEVVKTARKAKTVSAESVMAEFFPSSPKTGKTSLGSVVKSKSGAITIVKDPMKLEPKAFRKQFGLSIETAGWFVAMVEDAGNWGGMPLVGGNVDFGPSDWGRLSHLKTSGFVTTSKTRNKVNGKIQPCAWLHFTEAGVELAKQLLPGHDVSGLRAPGDTVAVL